MRRIPPNQCTKYLWKLMEKAIKEQLEAYMEQHNLFTKYQSGFRRNFSSEKMVNYLMTILLIFDLKKGVWNNWQRNTYSILIH